VIDVAELWLVRHGETDWSASGRHTGATDIPLSEAGRAAARALGAALATHAFATVLSSPLSRARETCILAGFGDQMQLVADLREWDYGEFDGLTTAEIRTIRPGWGLWADGCPGGESAPAVGARADRVIELVGTSDGDVLAFAHGHLLRVLAARWIGLPAADGALLALGTASLSVLGWEREQPIVRRWNVD
jgi:broad specificity phosphatase PhoE